MSYPPAPDPTAGFTDMQWYMYRQRNVAFFAAFTSRAFTDGDLLAAARALVELAPQLTAGFGAVSDALLRRLIHRESVATLDGFPDRWIDRGEAIFADPALPLFRIRHAAGMASSDGRAGFLLVQVSHALVEGAASVAPAPAIKTIAIGPSDPTGSSPSRSMTKKPRKVSTAACACPAPTPAMIHPRIRSSFQRIRSASRGEVAATTLAPVVAVASDG